MASSSYWERNPKKLSTQAELSATGMDSLRGVLLLSVPKSSQMGRYSFENDDVVLGIDGKQIVSKKFSKTMKQLKAGEHQYEKERFGRYDRRGFYPTHPQTFRR